MAGDIAHEYEIKIGIYTYKNGQYSLFCPGSMRNSFACTINIINIMRLFTCVFLFITLFRLPAAAQGLTDMAKKAARGGYSGTYLLDNGNMVVFYQSQEGLYAYEFDAKGGFVGEYTDSEAEQVLARVKGDDSYTKLAGIQEVKSLDVMNVVLSWGALKLETGKLKLSSDKRFIYGFELEETGRRKLKAEDTWKTNYIGCRTIIPENRKVYRFRGANGKHMMFDFGKRAASTMAPQDAAMQVAGVVVEKVSITNPSPHNMSRLVVFKAGGNDLQESSRVHVMPYSMQGVGSGVLANGNFGVMVMPLHAPSTYKPHKVLTAPETDRNNVYLYEVDADNKVVNEAVFKSDLRTVNFQVLAAGDRTFIIGTGAPGKNWRAFYSGQKMEGIVVSVLDEQGKVRQNRTYAGKDLSDKVQVAGTAGGKHNMKFTGGPVFYSSQKLDNGNVFIFGKSDGYHHGILVSDQGELISYYVFPHADLSKHGIYSEQLEVRGNKVYVVLTDQPNELNNDVKTSTSQSSHITGNYRITTTTTTTTQSFEIFHISRLFVIDGTNGNSNGKWVHEVLKNANTIGNIPALFTAEGVFFPVRIKGPRGKALGMVRFSY